MSFQACATCLFVRAGESGQPQCRKNPPKAEFGTRSRWPEVNLKDWCGAWEKHPHAEERKRDI